MIYPYCLKNQISPIFEKQLVGNGVFISLANDSQVYKRIDIKNQVQLQEYADELMSQNQTNWAISEFGENRKFMFTQLGHHQMVQQNRFIHLGLDIWVPVNTIVHAPLAGKIVISEYESGEGNYGGLVVIEHIIQDQKIYSVYGHLNKDHLPKAGTNLNAGQQFAKIGEMNSNGGYFYHIHLQVLTEKGYNQEMVHQGYTTEEKFKTIQDLCLDPRFLFSIN